MGGARKYSLVHEGEELPPKAVLGLAICIAKKVDEAVVEFSGGARTNEALRRLGFEILHREA